jgi:hypothetical protein
MLIFIYYTLCFYCPSKIVKIILAGTQTGSITFCYFVYKEYPLPSLPPRGQEREQLFPPGGNGKGGGFERNVNDLVSIHESFLEAGFKGF